MREAVSFRPFSLTLSPSGPRGRRAVPKSIAAQGRSEQIQGPRVQAEGLELLRQEAEALSLATALLLQLSNPDLGQDPP